MTQLNYSRQQFILVLSVILISKSLYFESYGQNALFVPLLGYSLYLGITYRIKLASEIFLYMLLFVVTAIFSSPAWSSFTLLLVRFLIGVIIVNLVDFACFAKIFSTIMLWIGLISMLTFPVLYFNVHSPLPLFVPLDERKIYNFIFFGVSNYVNSSANFRNNGLWWEPGAFAVFINLGYLLAIVSGNINFKKILIFAIVVISTLSTTGIIVFALLSLLLINWQRLNILSGLLLLASGWLVVVFSIAVGFSDMLFDKFDPSTSAFYSFLSRYYDLFISFHMFKTQPFTGYGYGTQIENAIPFGMKLIGQGLYNSPAKPTGSDGITMFIAQMGILALVFIWPLLFPRYLKSFSIGKRVVVAIALFLLFNTENFTYSMVFTLLSLYGLSAIARDYASEKAQI